MDRFARPKDRFAFERVWRSFAWDRSAFLRER
jgi:hypothetical protein